MEPPWDGGTKVCSNDPGHMTNMAAMIIYGKTFKHLLLGSYWLMSLKLGLQHRALKYSQVCSNVDPRLTFELFTQRSTLGPYAFVWEKA